MILFNLSLNHVYTFVHHFVQIWSNIVSPFKVVQYKKWCLYKINFTYAIPCNDMDFKKSINFHHCWVDVTWSKWWLSLQCIYLQWLSLLVHLPQNQEKIFEKSQKFQFICNGCHCLFIEKRQKCSCQQNWPIAYHTFVLFL